MGYTYPGSGPRGPNNAVATNQAIISSYPAYMAANRAQPPISHGVPPYHLGGGGYAPPYGAHGPISLSSPPATIACRYCHKQHIPNPEFNSIHPATKEALPTCSSDCQTKLLKSMLASYSRAPVIPPSSAPSPYNAPVPGYPVASGAYASHHPMQGPINGMPSHGAPVHRGGPVSWPSATGPPAAGAYGASSASYLPSKANFSPYTSATSNPMATPQQSFPPPSGVSPVSLPVVGSSKSKSTLGNEGKKTPQDQPKAQKKHKKSKHADALTQGPSSATSSSSSSSAPNSNSNSNATKSKSTQVLTGNGMTTRDALNNRIMKWLDCRKSMALLWQVNTVVLDTNVLLDGSPDVVLGLHQYSASLKFIVPFVLIQELDSLKARSYGPNAAARQAISALYENLVLGSKKDKWIRGQKPGEFVALEGTIRTTSGDDRILECANYFHRYSPPGSRAMLLTHDKNLTLKATLCGIQTGSVANLRHFLESYQWLEKERTMLQRLITLNPEFQLNPDFRLEDYSPHKEDEEDEFQKMKAQHDQLAMKEKQEAEKAEKAKTDRAKLDAQRAETRAILPSGTRVDIYDLSSDDDPLPTPSAPQSSTAYSSSSSSTASVPQSITDKTNDSSEKKSKKKKKSKKSKKRQREENAKNDLSDSESTSQAEPPTKRKKMPSTTPSTSNDSNQATSNTKPSISNSSVASGKNSPIIVLSDDE